MIPQRHTTLSHQPANPSAGLFLSSRFRPNVVFGNIPGALLKEVKTLKKGLVIFRKEVKTIFLVRC